MSLFVVTGLLFGVVRPWSTIVKNPLRRYMGGEGNDENRAGMPFSLARSEIGLSTSIGRTNTVSIF